ncbi:MAG: FtsQ-type POTRA domain-containing protein [Patescibacteria group bacterium]|nr:FtsQ-type POTRA domain-containing protein [Patescibacteria group bacterium]
MQKRFRKPYRIKHKRYWYKNKALWFMIISFVIVVLSVYVLWFLPFLQIKEIEISGNESIDKERVVIITEEKISQKVLGLRSSSILFVNKSEISKALQDWFPEIESVSVHRNFPSKLTLDIFLRQEIISWCRFVEDSQVCLGVDRYGIAFQDSVPIDIYITGPPKLKELSWGDRVIDPDLLSKLLDFRAEVESWSILREDEVRVVELSIISENWVYVILSEGWAAYINPKENMDWQSTKLKLVLESEVPREKRGKLLYLDLRFGDQAFVKYQEE